MPKEPKTAVEKYIHSNIMTAGKGKSVLMLLDKACSLVGQIDPENPGASAEDLRQCRNIIAQLEMALNLKNSEAAQHIFEVFDLSYTALERPTAKSLEVAAYLLRDLSEALKEKLAV